MAQFYLMQFKSCINGPGLIVIKIEKEKKTCTFFHDSSLASLVCKNRVDEKPVLLFWSYFFTKSKSHSLEEKQSKDLPSTLFELFRHKMGLQ